MSGIDERSGAPPGSFDAADVPQDASRLLIVADLVEQVTAVRSQSARRLLDSWRGPLADELRSRIGDEGRAALLVAGQLRAEARRRASSELTDPPLVWEGAS